MCSIHFLDGRPTISHPDPELFLFPGSQSKLKVVPSKRRKRRVKNEEHNSAAATVLKYEECPPDAYKSEKEALHKQHDNTNRPDDGMLKPSSRTKRKDVRDLLKFTEEDHSACVPAAGTHSSGLPSLPDEITGLHFDSATDPFQDVDQMEEASEKRHGWLDHQYFRKSVKPTVFAALKFVVFLLLGVIRKLRAENTALKDEVKSLRTELAKGNSTATVAERCSSKKMNSKCAKKRKSSANAAVSDDEARDVATDPTDLTWYPGRNPNKRKVKKSKLRRPKKDVVKSEFDVAKQSVLYQSGDTFFFVNELPHLELE